MPDSAWCLDTSHFHFHQKSPKRAVVLVFGHCIFLEPDQESSRRPRAKYLGVPANPPTYPLPLPHATRLTYDPAPRTSDLPGKPLSKESRGHKEAQGRSFPGKISDSNPVSGLGVIFGIPSGRIYGWLCLCSGVSKFGMNRSELLWVAESLNPRPQNLGSQREF